MPWYYVPVTIIEYGRKALIEADSAADAKQLIRDGAGWDSCSDATHYKTTIARGTVDAADERETAGSRNRGYTPAERRQLEKKQRTARE